MKKGPTLAEIDRLKDEVKLDISRKHVESLKKSNAAHDRSDAASLRILELQRDRQKVALDRTNHNIEKLLVKAPLAGVVALENIWRNGSMGHAQEGDQLWRGQALVRIFDPSQMQVRVTVGEPDGAVMQPGCLAKVFLDAYPDLVFPARFVSASPVAASASPVPSYCSGRSSCRGSRPRATTSIRCPPPAATPTPCSPDTRARREPTAERGIEGRLLVSPTRQRGPFPRWRVGLTREHGHGSGRRAVYTVSPGRDSAGRTSVNPYISR